MSRLVASSVHARYPGKFGSQFLRILGSNSSVHIRDLLDDSDETREYLKEKERLELGESKFYPENFHSEVDLLVYGNKVALISYRTLIAVVIENMSIAKAQRQCMEFIWKHTA